MDTFIYINFSFKFSPGLIQFVFHWALIRSDFINSGKILVQHNTWFSPNVVQQLLIPGFIKIFAAVHS